MSGPPAIETLVPHASTMLLIDRVVSWTSNAIRVEANMRRSQIFFRPGFGVPAYVGLEMMAQAVCAWDGLKRRHSGKSPAIGLLLGCRRYKTSRLYFAEGECLHIDAVSVTEDAAMSAFACSIRDPAGVELASCALSAYRPKDSPSA